MGNGPNMARRRRGGGHTFQKAAIVDLLREEVWLRALGIPPVVLHEGDGAHALGRPGGIQSEIGGELGLLSRLDRLENGKKQLPADDLGAGDFAMRHAALVKKNRDRVECSGLGVQGRVQDRRCGQASLPGRRSQ